MILAVQLMDVYSYVHLDQNPYLKTISPVPAGGAVHTTVTPVLSLRLVCVAAVCKSGMIN